MRMDFNSRKVKSKFNLSVFGGTISPPGRKERDRNRASMFFIIIPFNIVTLLAGRISSAGCVQIFERARVQRKAGNEYSILVTLGK